MTVTTPHADRDRSESPLQVLAPEGEHLACGVCPETLVDTSGGRLEHHEDGSHTYYPARIAWELEDGDNGRPFWNVDGAAAGPATGGSADSSDAAPATVHDQAVIDAAHLERQRAWSRETFGPGPRTAGVIDHIRDELLEVEAEPEDVTEWADIVILALDGAWRAGHEPQEILDAIVAKQARNEARTWPDWRTAPADQRIEHVRPPECQCLDRRPHAAHEWASLSHRWSCDGVARNGGE